MPSLIERNTPEEIAQHHAHRVPCVGVESATMQEEDRTTIASPIEIVKSHRTDDHLMIFGQSKHGRLEACYFEHLTEHFQLFDTIHDLSLYGTQLILHSL